MELLRGSSSSWKGKLSVLNAGSGVGRLEVGSEARYLVFASEITPLITNAGYPNLVKAE